MKKIWIDILTPKQVMIFDRLIRKLVYKYELLITTREYTETNELLKLKEINAVKIGIHGGGTLDGKLNASLERTIDLFKLIKNEKPDLLISLASPEASRIAFGIKIPHICLNDIPEANDVARLTVPLSSLIISPKLIPKSTWEKYGIESEKIIQYNALDPVAWLKDFTPDRNVLNNLEIEKEKPIIVIRPEEIHAAYLKGKIDSTNVIIKILYELMDEIDANFIIIPRYLDQKEQISKLINRDVIIVNNAIDGPSLLAYSDIFIGGGGTMTLEAALLGTPAICCRAFRTMYDDYAIKKGIVINGDMYTVEKVETILKNSKYKEKLRIKASKLMENMDDPVEIICTNIEKFI